MWVHCFVKVSIVACFAQEQGLLFSKLFRVTREPQWKYPPLAIAALFPLNLIIFSTFGYVPSVSFSFPCSHTTNFYLSLLHSFVLGISYEFGEVFCLKFSSVQHPSRLARVSQLLWSSLPPLLHLGYTVPFYSSILYLTGTLEGYVVQISVS